MFEHYRQPLLSRAEFYARVVCCLAIAGALLIFFILIGLAGFCLFEKYTPLDAVLNSILIMVGVGANNPISTSAGKAFAAFYALFSSVAFYAILIVIFSPLVHRFLHKFHLDLDKKRSGDA